MTGDGWSIMDIYFKLIGMTLCKYITSPITHISSLILLNSQCRSWEGLALIRNEIERFKVDSFPTPKCPRLGIKGNPFQTLDKTTLTTGTGCWGSLSKMRKISWKMKWWHGTFPPQIGHLLVALIILRVGKQIFILNQSQTGLPESELLWRLTLSTVRFVILKSTCVINDA